jgi:hypothetical protein
LNVSGGGLLVCDPFGLSADDEIEIELLLDDHSAPVRAVARVTRTLPEDRAALRLDVMAERDRDRIARFVTDRQRIELRIGRGLA